ncbi:tolloid-like protein 2 [Dreissena polymorpha]|uniref:tolloid-like protein 2 n=1 Tax=Dreissena polymorpha TaxID=45954 RepID=UPI0022647DBC|nr:tolloid-like protein 2 [Dreissena polymorpha]
MMFSFVKDSFEPEHSTSAVCTAIVNFSDCQLEGCSDSCTCDYLQLFNGPNVSSPSIGNYCGAEPLKGFQSQLNSFGIVFSTDHSAGYKGFRLTYTFTQGPCDSVTGACENGVCKNGWKGISCDESCQLGSYSVNCSQQCYCRVGPCGGVTVHVKMMAVTFTDFSLEYHFKCNYDFLELSHEPNASSSSFGKFCGTAHPRGFQSRSNSVGIFFSTDSGVNAKGFNLPYAFFEQGCQLGSYSVNCSKHCHCRVGPCDSVTVACGNGGCKDGWKGIACNENRCQILQVCGRHSHVHFA